jgi:hypothetical protein
MAKLIKVLGLAGLISLLAATQAKPAKAQDYGNEAYLIASQTSLNPSEYNDKIRQVSLGDVFGNTTSIGMGYQRDFGNFIGRLELMENSQTVDAIKQDLTGNKVVYGYNAMTLRNIDPEVAYKTQLGETTSLEAGIGPAITIASLESSNGTDTATSHTTIAGGKASLSLSQRIGRAIVKLSASYRTGKSESLDVSGMNVGVNAGMEF